MTGICNPVEVSMSEAAKECLITIKVKHEVRFWFRMWLMTRLLLLAKWASPVTMEIEDVDA